MKRLLLAIILIAVISSLSGCINNTNGDIEETAPFKIDFIESKNVTVIDEQYIGLFFNFTNNSGSTITPDDLVRVEAFQNGIALEMTTFCGQKTEGAASCDMSIQNGTTTKVVWLFTREDNSEISVEISDGQKFTIK